MLIGANHRCPAKATTSRQLWPPALAKEIPAVVERRRLAADLARLEIPPEPGVLVHCSMGSIGNVTGGPAAILAALRDALGTTTTIVVPTQTANNSFTSPTHHLVTAGMSSADLRTYVDAMPGFDPAATPSFAMGRFAEHVRIQREAVRSTHPQSSFAAIGRHARDWMDPHDLDCHLGDRSPLGAMYRAGAHTLLLGVGFASCTAFHLAEYRLDVAPLVRPHRCFIQREGRRDVVEFHAPHLDASDFDAIGAAYCRQRPVTVGRVGAATAMAFPIRSAVDFATLWMNANRQSRPTPANGAA